jgi:hypothetical protein
LAINKPVEQVCNQVFDSAQLDLPTKNEGFSLHGDFEHPTFDIGIWLVVWNMFFHILGMSSSQLTFTPSFFRGVAQPPTRLLLTIINHILH